MKKIFVSGCYDILHAGHIQFFEDAKALGDHLTVCFASDAVLKLAKGRTPSMPEDNKRILIGAISHVNEALSSSDLDPVFDFKSHLLRIKPDILAVTEDDKNTEAKRALCAPLGIEVVVLPKRNNASRVSTTKILAGLKGRITVPLRVDFAGGWLDVPKLSRPGAFIVNCTISPQVSLEDWPYEKSAGLGGSAAYALLQVKNGVESEAKLGVGWQDPAVISETGLCVWRSGKKPVLDAKWNPDWLEGKMLIVWTGKSHSTPDIVKAKRDYSAIAKAGALARKAAYASDVTLLAKAVLASYKAQLGEGMDPLPAMKKSIARKYLGGGWGGYALYLFKTKNARDAAAKAMRGSKKIEPFLAER